MIIIVKMLAIITRAFKTINNAIIIIKVMRILIIITAYICVSKLTLKMSVIITRYIIITAIITVIKKEWNKNVKLYKTFKSFS